MRVTSVLLKAVKPDVARLIEAGVVIDTTDRSLDTTELRRRFPNLRLTPLADVAAREYADRLRQH